MVPVGKSVVLLIVRASLMYDVHCLASLGYGSLPLYVNWVVPLQLEAGVGFGSCLSTCLACVLIYFRCMIISWIFTIDVVSLNYCFGIYMWPGARCAFCVMMIH